ncbi:MAG TPA: hypothetical protein VMQ40_07720 [Acidimicrobiales bacterium]|nr:hypothetical protein [Acidimicrobiales bacterium]
MARLTRRASVAAAIAAAMIGLASCGGGANQDAVAACRGIHRALIAYDRSLHAPNAAVAAADQQQATHDAAGVETEAAMAASGDGAYAGLMTLLQQSQELPFANVAPGLRSACNSISAGTNDL